MDEDGMVMSDDDGLLGAPPGVPRPGFEPFDGYEQDMIARREQRAQREDLQAAYYDMRRERDAARAETKKAAKVIASQQDEITYLKRRLDRRKGIKRGLGRRDSE